ncbi:MAG: YbbR-like domain-containing protein [Chitinophagales bacterium]
MTNNEGRTWHLKLISVLVAILLWVFITSENLVIAQKEVSGVKLTVMNQEPQVTVSYPETVNVSIVGVPREAGEISAYVNLKGKGPGEYELPVQVKPMAGTRVTKISPGQVRVVIAEIQEFVFPVTYQVTTPPPAGYQVAGVDVNPSRCAVRGSQEEANKVASLGVLLDLSAVTDTTSLRKSVRFLDRHGHQVTTDLEVVPDEVQAYVVIEKEQSSVSVTVTPSLTGSTATGYVVDRVLVVPETATVLGLAADLTVLQTINTEDIDLTGKDSSFEQEVALKADPKLTVFPARVKVMVEIKSEQGATP